MQHFKDNKNKYYDGSLGGVLGLLNSLNSSVRDSYGYDQGMSDAKSIIANLARDGSGNIVESIKVISHSMGGAYAKGFIRALKDYILENNIEGVQIYEYDFAPFQPSDQEAIEGVPTWQYSHSEDRVAGNDPIKGASQENTSSDTSQGHSIFDFFNQIKNLPAGSYTVVNGKIVPTN